MQCDGKQLLIASKQYANENRWVSWWHITSSFFLLISLVILASSSSSWLVAPTSSLLTGLLLVRVFILYHDFLHGTILRNSKLAKFLMHAFGLFILSPAVFWKHSHDDHHKNNCRSFDTHVGTYPVMTTIEYQRASLPRRISYRIIRSPLIILLGYLTSLLWNNCLLKLIKNPLKNSWAGIAILVHFAVLGLAAWVSIQAILLGLVVPLFIAGALGTYLFYAQHNFPGMKRRTGHQWDYVHAALQSSSYMEMSPMMHWFTGNIGYHHVHHLNAAIPFYRLPAAMAGLRELQDPKTTSLSAMDIAACLRLKLWDPEEERLLTFREAKQLQSIIT